MIEEKELPEGWKWTTIGTITAINPRLDISLMLESTPVSFIPMAAVEAGTGCVDTSAQRQLKEVKKGYTAFRENDVLFAKITPCMENGKSAVVRSLSSGIGFGSTEFHVLRMSAGIDPQLLYYYVSQEVFRQNARAHMTGTAGQLRVPPAFLADAPFPLAPLPEQHRIVTAIEQQFTRLDAAVTALQHAKTKLKRYRAAVLKAAVEGKLTEAWRAEHPATEPASALLERILVERRAKWEADLRAKGKDPAKVKYVEPAMPDVKSLPELPEGWTWVNLGQLAWSVKDGPHYSPKYSNKGIPFITGGNVRPRGVDFANAKYITPELHAELSVRCKPEKGDILYTKGGTTGIARVNTYDTEFSVWVHVAVLKLCDSIDPFYMQHTLNSPFCYKQAQSFTHGVGNQDLGLTRMVRIVLSFPPLAEQNQIVAEIERRLSVIDQLEGAIEANLKRAERLRQSILKEAFAGRLVPQDPNDEPASMLLECIRKEREEQKRGSTSKQRALKNISFPKVPDEEPVDIDANEMEQMDLWAGTGSRE